MQAFVAEDFHRPPLRRRRRGRLRSGARNDEARAIVTAIAIFLAFSSVVVRALARRARRHRRSHVSAARCLQFLLYAVLARARSASSREVWNEVRPGGGRGGADRRTAALTPAIVGARRPDAVPPPSRGVVAFEHVGFAYPTRPDAVLRGVAFAVEPGETVAIVGPSGAGKSTLFHCWSGSTTRPPARILLDGVDIATARSEGAAGGIALVPQDPLIFAASVADNIAYGRPGAARRRDRRPPPSAPPRDGFISALPQGYDTRSASAA